MRVDKTFSTGYGWRVDVERVTLTAATDGGDYVNRQNGQPHLVPAASSAASPGLTEERMNTEASLIRVADKLEKLHEQIDLAVQERDHFAVKLHREGASLAKVASLARVTRGRVWQIVQREEA